MPYKRINVCGERYYIVPSLENMCALEQDTGTNLIQGVNPNRIDLCFMRATIEHLLVDDDGKHITTAVLDKLYQDDVGTAQRIFADIYSQMYHFPKIPKSTMSLPQTTKKAMSLLKLLPRLRRDGL